MVWMEMIRLRATEGQTEAALGLLRYSVNNVVKEPGLVQIHVYNSASFHGDMALSLVWDTHLPHRQGKQDGLDYKRNAQCLRSCRALNMGGEGSEASGTRLEIKVGAQGAR